MSDDMRVFVGGAVLLTLVVMGVLILRPGRSLQEQCSDECVAAGIESTRAMCEWRCKWGKRR